MKEVLVFIRRNTRLSSKIEGLQREDIPEYSPIIIREVLTNAFVHADYSIQGMHLRVMVFSDRMEIESPGMLPIGYTLEDFTAGVSHVRNKVIARTFRELGQMEEWGTGYKRILEVCRQGRYPIPTWEEVGTSIKVTLYPCSLEKADEKKALEITVRQSEIIKLLRKEQTLTAKEIHARLQQRIAERTLRSDLQRLKSLHVLESKGSGPATYWTLIKKEGRSK